MARREGKPPAPVLSPDSTYARWRDVMPCYLSVQDRDLRVVEINNLFRRDFGDARGELCHVVYKGRDTPCEGCPVLRTFEDGEVHTSEETVITRDGERASVVVTSAPLYDDQGRVSSVVEMSTNITELRSLRRELRRREQRFRDLFNLVPCYVSVQDRDFRVIESNEAFRRDFDPGDGQRPCYQVYKGRASPCPECPVEKSFADGQVHTGEETVITRDGSRASVVVHSMPVRDERGAITAVMEVSTNITEIKQLQRRLAMMGLAVAGMAHRIKNILMGLEGGIFVVNTGFEMGDQQTIDQGWEMVERNVTNISQTVKDLLFCAKKREPKVREGVDPCAVVREVYDLYAPRARREGIRLELALDSSVAPGCYDGDGLSRLTTNLVSNALDACRFDPDTAREHVIALAVRRLDDGATLIEVADNGPGIPDDVRHKVFENFFSTKGTEGTGLGLLVVQKIAEEHGGRVSFTSRVGEGTTFRAVVPPCGLRAAEPEVDPEEQDLARELDDAAEG